MPVFEVIVILVLILLNGLLAMSEIALAASRKPLLQHMAASRRRGAEVALALAEHPTRFLSTVQVGITLVGILAGAFGGATLTTHLAAELERIPALAPYSEPIAFVAIVSAIAYCSLIFGELVPKRIALTRPEALAASVAPLMRTFARLVAPVVAVLTFSTELVLKMLRVSTAPRPVVTEQEIAALLSQAAEAGVVHPVEQDIAERVFRLGDRTVRSIMTARPDVQWVNAAETQEAIWGQIAAFPHSHILVCDGELDHVMGVARAADLLSARLQSKALTIQDFVRQPLFVPSTMTLLRLLEALRASTSHVAVVLDEFGAVAGIVTLTDILEGLVGDMPGDAAHEEVDLVQRPDGSWLVDGTVPVEEVFRRLDLGEIPEQERSAYHTLAGFVVSRLGRIPRAGEAFDWQRARFEVVDMDERRVDKVLIVPPPDADQPRP